MRHYLLSLILCICVFPKTFAQSYEDKKLEVTLRQIGFDLLRKSGDSTSRVMPIEKTQDHTYKVYFEKNIQFVTDTLINTVKDVFQVRGIKNGYIVSVKTVAAQQTIYTYEVSSATDYQIPCLGIMNPLDKYYIEIIFLKETPSISNIWIIVALLMVGGLSFLLYCIYIRKVDAKNLGKYSFNLENKKLSFNSQKITLTQQEEKLLSILFGSKNELVSRDLLQNEIWEKDGIVVTSRSLDVLVSKLRKKLSEDETIKISNIHGKGYKLEL